MKSPDSIVPPRVRSPASIEILAAAIRSLFPAGCAVATERRAAGPEGLTPLEAIAVRKAAPERQGEFAAGRIAARRALAGIGVIDAEIPAGADRAPVWPAGVIGSISHASDVAVAVVAPIRRMEAIGIDLEVDAALHQDLWPLVLVPAECTWVESQPAAHQRAWATTLFSAKEAFYKFQYPLTGRWLDFRDVEITLQSEERFTVKVLQPAVPALAAEFSGRTLRVDGLTVTVLHRGRAAAV